MPQDDRPVIAPLQFLTVEAEGFCDPVTGLCETPATTAPDDEEPTLSPGSPAAETPR